MLDVIIRNMHEKWRYYSILEVMHNGELILEESDSGKPEDNTFTRDYKWIAPIIKKAYELGRADAKA